MLEWTVVQQTLGAVSRLAVPKVKTYIKHTRDKARSLSALLTFDLNLLLKNSYKLMDHEQKWLMHFYNDRLSIIHHFFIRNSRI